MPRSGFSSGGFRGGSPPSAFRGGAGPGRSFSRPTPSMPRSTFTPGVARPSVPRSTFTRPSFRGSTTPGAIGRGPGTVGSGRAITPRGMGRDAGTIGSGRAITPRGPGRSGEAGIGRGPGRGPEGTVRTPGRGPGDAVRRGPGRGPGDTIRGPGRGPGDSVRRGTGRGPGDSVRRGTGRGPGDRVGRGGRGGEARDRWRNDWNRHRGDWKRHGDWKHNNRWHWNNSLWWGGFFWYPWFTFGLGYGYWGFNDCGAFCTYSPFYYYGYPYVYAPRVVVQEVPVYTYTTVPGYATDGYYLSQGAYAGLNAALEDIRTAFINNQPDLLLRHTNANTQIQIFLDGSYAYSISGSDYQQMVRDAVSNIQTSSLTFDSVQQRSDGAYTATGTHVFTDIQGNQKTVEVSFTLARSGNNWIIVAAGSSGS